MAHGLTGSLRCYASECFKMGNDVYVPYFKISHIFNKRGNKSIESFDKDNWIIHPTKGKLYLYPGKVVIIKNEDKIIEKIPFP